MSKSGDAELVGGYPKGFEINKTDVLKNGKKHHTTTTQTKYLT